MFGAAVAEDQQGARAGSRWKIHIFLGGDDSIEDLSMKNSHSMDVTSMNGDLMGYVTVNRGQMISG